MESGSLHVTAVDDQDEIRAVVHHDEFPIGIVLAEEIPDGDVYKRQRLGWVTLQRPSTGGHCGRPHRRFPEDLGPSLRARRTLAGRHFTARQGVSGSKRPEATRESRAPVAPNSRGVPSRAVID